MRKLLIILIVLICSVSSFAGMKEKYEQKKLEQKYKFLYQIREVKQEGRIKLIRAKIEQKVRRIYCYRRYYRGSYNYGRMYSNRQCP